MKTAQTMRLVLFGHLIVSFFCVLLILTVMFRYPFKGRLGVLGSDRTNDASGVVLASSSFFFLLSCFININCSI